MTQMDLDAISIARERSGDCRWLSATMFSGQVVAGFRILGRCPYLGIHADESALRMDVWEREGENIETTRIPCSSPLSIWTDADVWAYIRRFGLSYPSVYDMGYQRTGCMFCMFGITMDRDRFLRLKQTHPKQWAYCMRPLDAGGLGLREVLDYMGIPTGCEQCNLDDFTTEAERCPRRF